MNQIYHSIMHNIHVYTFIYNVLKHIHFVLQEIFWNQAR